MKRVLALLPALAVLADELPPLLDREIFFGDPQGLRRTLPPGRSSTSSRGMRGTVSQAS